MTLNICYITCRRNPRFEWFADSLMRQWEKACRVPLKLIVVDFHAASRDWKAGLTILAQSGADVVITPPHGNVWQGPYRLTTCNYFAASTARNTGLMHADDGYIVYVDDLSVLVPGWLEQVLEAARDGWVACGAYAKVSKLTVDNGVIKSFADVAVTDTTVASISNHVQSYYPVGFDNRWKHAPIDDYNPHPCAGNWLFGASCAMPVEAALKVNGFDTDCDGMGGEDQLFGLMLERAGYQLRYCKRMMTLESDEAHSEDTPFARTIKGPANGPDEQTNKSWVMLRMVLQGGRDKSPNYYGEGGLAAVRQRVLSGEPMPVIGVPDRDWYDGQLLATM